MEASFEPWPPVKVVREWLVAAGFPVSDHPTLEVPDKAREMACALIEEEAAEFRAAVEASNLVEIADAIADLIWVTLEAAATFGIPVEPVFAEVRRSNWTKIKANEPVVTAAGKVVAGPGFSPPDLLPILAEHAASPEHVADWIRRQQPPKAGQRRGGPASPSQSGLP